MRMLVTGASTFFATRLIEGLGARGVAVTAADTHRWSVGKASRYTVRKLRLPSLARDPAGYLGRVLEELHSRRYDLLLPTFEESLLLAEFRDDIEPLTRMFLPQFETMWRVHHKPSLHRLCLELGIPTPPTVTPATPAELERHVQGLRFPVVLKLPAANNCIGRVYCSDIRELTQRFTEVCRQQTTVGAGAPFVQQKIDGAGVYTLMLCRDGQKVGEVIYRPLRTYPDREGTSAHRESIRNREIESLTARLAQATGWTGFLGLDFLVDRATGVPYLIDANPRATPAVQLGCLAGVDWPGLLIDMAAGRRIVPLEARPGVRNRTLLLDVGWLLEGLTPQRNWLPGALRRVRGFLKPHWTLDSTHDYLGAGEWSCTLTLAGQALVALGKSLATGRPLGSTILDGLNYDPQTVGQMRRLQMTARPAPAAIVADEQSRPFPVSA